MYIITWAKMQWKLPSEDAREKVQSVIIIHVMEGGISRKAINKMSVLNLCRLLILSLGQKPWRQTFFIFIYASLSIYLVDIDYNNTLQSVHVGLRYLTQGEYLTGTRVRYIYPIWTGSWWIVFLPLSEHQKSKQCEHFNILLVGFTSFPSSWVFLLGIRMGVNYWLENTNSSIS